MKSVLLSACVWVTAEDTCSLGTPHAFVMPGRVHTSSVRHPTLVSHCTKPGAHCELQEGA